MAEEFNPKNAIGRTKLPVHLWPSIATAYGSIGMLEGQTKYGRSNFRAAKVAASVYYAAAKRHLDAWFEGEENTKEGGPHLGNALACIAIILDARLVGTLVDDRQYNPAGPDAFNKMVEELTEQGRAMVAGLKIAQEPKHWDKRNEMPVQEFPGLVGDLKIREFTAEERAAFHEALRSQGPGKIVRIDKDEP